jgi:hypothetical protein
MATTKVGGGVVDLNSDNTSFKMPVGSSLYSGTPVAGMIRNNSSISNGTAQTTFEYYNGTSWVGMSAPPILNVAFLVIAGGAGGGGGNYNNSGSAQYAGGGGAGGYRNSYASETSGANSATETPLTVTSGTTYTITVGGGGAKGGFGTYNPSAPYFTPPTSAGFNGGDSSISGSDITTITSVGGGGGGLGSVQCAAVNSGQNGGSGGGKGGGGGGCPFGSAGNGTANQGTNGTNDGGYNGGDGGGASAGVSGLSSLITGSSVSRGGAGRGGGAVVGRRIGVDGGGSGAYSSTNTNGDNGTNNTGGGGGGSAGNGQTNPGGNGGSGVVILRMLTSIYSGTQSGASVTTDGSDTILTYTGSGTYTA